MYEDENNEDNKFEIVQGNSKDLNFSEVKDNLTIEEHHNNEKATFEANHQVHSIMWLYFLYFCSSNHTSIIFKFSCNYLSFKIFIKKI